jgi:hypothetical protein
MNQLFYGSGFLPDGGQQFEFYYLYLYFYFR